MPPAWLPLVVGILGMGGIGKTALYWLARDLKDQFEAVIWRSLRNGPLFEEILSDWIQFLSHQEQTLLRDRLDKVIRRINRNPRDENFLNAPALRSGWFAIRFYSHQD